MVQTDKILEFDKIKEMWTELALTEWAKEKIRDTVPCMSESELMARQRETSEARECIQAVVKGACLSITQLEDMEKLWLLSCG